ncbi:MAG: glycosyltransferase family protein [bacterium]|nr:glycosyltransferase family protein [bacterium]
MAIIQARMGSTRLPGKVLLDLAGETVLERAVSRTLRTQDVDDVVVATSLHPSDDVIESLCAHNGWHWFRGSLEDVLDRYYHAAMAYKADAVVRVTSDCPLIEPEIIGQIVREFLHLQPDVHYACNILPRRTFPRGLDAEIMRSDVLERAWLDDSNPAWREHVTPYIQNHTDLFRIHGVTNEVDYSHMRWTVDTPEDLIFVRRVFQEFGHADFSWREVLALLEQHPDWAEVNRHVRQKLTDSRELGS